MTKEGNGDKLDNHNVKSSNEITSDESIRSNDCGSLKILSARTINEEIARKPSSTPRSMIVEKFPVEIPRSPRRDEMSVEWKFGRGKIREMRNGVAATKNRSVISSFRHTSGDKLSRLGASGFFARDRNRNESLTSNNRQENGQKVRHENRQRDRYENREKDRHENREKDRHENWEKDRHENRGKDRHENREKDRYGNRKKDRQEENREKDGRANRFENRQEEYREVRRENWQKDCAENTPEDRLRVKKSLGFDESRDARKTEEAGGDLENDAEAFSISSGEGSDEESWLGSESSGDSSPMSVDEKIGDTTKEVRGQIRGKVVEEDGTPLRRDCVIHDRDAYEYLCSNLHDFGIDPEWSGIPDATYSQILEYLKHRRKLNSKKYRKYEEIRQKLLQELAMRVRSRDTKNCNVSTNEQFKQLDKFVTNVKTRVSKALNILEMNDGSQSARSASQDIKNRERRNSRDYSSDRSRKTRIVNEPTELRVSGHLKNSATIASESPGTGDGGEIKTARVPRRASHSYEESVRGFARNEIPGKSAKSIFSVTESGAIVTNPRKNQSQEISTCVVDRIAKTREPNLSVESFDSPRNTGKSVLKSTSSGQCLVQSSKKKVLFDLESSGKMFVRHNEVTMYPTRDDDEDDDENEDDDKNDSEEKEKNDKSNNNDGSESDFEISSILDEKDATVEREKADTTNVGKVVLRTSQSEKIAEISQRIEKQLNLARRKPAGAIDAAMFLDKSIHESDKRDTLISGYTNFPSPRKSSIESTKLLQTDTALTWQNRNSQYLPQQNGDKKEDTNLDLDIDELLRLE